MVRSEIDFLQITKYQRAAEEAVDVVANIRMTRRDLLFERLPQRTHYTGLPFAPRIEIKQLVFSNALVAGGQSLALPNL
jgi:hypothetical protein